MKKLIIVAIDFSKNSIHALEYSIIIANALNADIMMVWIDKPSEDSIYVHEDNSIRIEAKKRMEELVNEYGARLNKDSNISYKLRKGKVHSEISGLAKLHNAYIVIAGSHGSSGYEAYWIGSNANKIVAHSPCSVFTIKDNYKFAEKITNIVLPIDNTSTTCQKVTFAADFAAYFGARVHVLALQSSSLNSLRMKVDSFVKRTTDYLEEKKVAYLVESIDADNVTTATINYTEKSGADLIVIMTEQEGASHKIWLGTYAQQMVNVSHVPVLSVHPDNEKNC